LTTSGGSIGMLLSRDKLDDLVTMGGNGGS
jgi:hypothetical protein